MVYPFAIYRPTNNTESYDSKHLKAVREAIARGKEVLKNYPPVDTFAGRKTQDAFPDEVSQPDYRR